MVAIVLVQAFPHTIGFLVFSNAREAMIPAVAWSSHQSFDKGVDVHTRVETIKDLVNDMCDAFISGGFDDGAQSYQELLKDKIRAAGLLEDNVWMHVDNIGVHPDNREQYGLVPIDVHDLLARIANDGWSFAAVDTMAAEVPPGKEGDAWRAFNESLANNNHLLPDIQGSFMTHVTARGSHTTAAIRLLKFRTKGVHPQLTDDNGYIDAEKVFKYRPSLRQPITKGIPYTIIKHELVSACPKLMKVFARTGNISHGVHRIATMLQGCNALFLAYKETNSWAQAQAQVCQAQPPEFQEGVKHLISFVMKHSGGEDGQYLHALEKYEKSLGVKRKIAASDLGLLAGVNFQEGPRYVPAMAKAMLNSPPNKVQNGFSTLFSANDMASIQPNGKNRKLALKASELMISSTSFLEAYSRLDSTTMERLISEFEVALVMHVHNFKSETRQTFPTIIHVAKHCYETWKKHDPSLPTWSKLKDVVDDKPVVIATPSSSIVELREDGTIPSCELIKNGFEINKHVKQKGGEEHVFKLTEFCEDGKHVTLQHDGTEEDIKVERIKLLNTYKPHIPEKPIMHRFDDNAPADTFENLTISIWKGLAKAAIASQFQASSESNVLIQSWPKVKAIAGAKFAVGKLNIVAITNNIEVVKKIPSNTQHVGLKVADVSDTLILVAKPHLSMPKEIKTSDHEKARKDVFHASYWAMHGTNDTRLANVVPSSKMVSTKLFGKTYDICVPFYTNDKEIQKGQELLLLNPEPERKRARIESETERQSQVESKSVKSVKGKAKGKGKNKKAK